MPSCWSATTPSCAPRSRATTPCATCCAPSSGSSRRSATCSIARSQLEQATRRHEGRYAAIEQELNDLANLYVASFQLHSTLKPPHVLQHIRELLAQLVGAECFVIYVLSDDGKLAMPVGSEGVLES